MQSNAPVANARIGSTSKPGKDRANSRKPFIKIGLIIGYAIFLGASFVVEFSMGEQIGRNFLNFAWTMLKMMPFVFLLIGLFEVWVSRETVEKHLGTESGAKGYLWAILLAGTVMGPLYVALPVAYSLYHKGARLGVIFTYIGAAAICRVPMTAFEASFLGFKFTAIRFLVSLPLVVVTSVLLEKHLVTTDYVITKQ
jgi:uncharacterized membrane protein YraQ (UPF0718 family)